MAPPPSITDDDVLWKQKAAEHHPFLAAAELFFMARPSERVPWRLLLDDMEANHSDGFSPFLLSRPRSPPRGWGRKRVRSRANNAQPAVDASKEEKNAWSPTTPLTWRGASPSTSGGGCEKRKRQRTGSGGEAVVAPAGGSATKDEMNRFENGVVVKSTVAAKRRQGKKKMTLAELKDCEKELLDKRAELQKEMEEQRRVHRLLLEENERLKNQELRSQVSAASEPNEACAMAEEAKAENRRFLPFDLNLSFQEEMDSAP